MKLTESLVVLALATLIGVLGWMGSELVGIKTTLARIDERTLAMQHDTLAMQHDLSDIKILLRKTP
jgi:hypothetical protein